MQQKPSFSPELIALAQEYHTVEAPARSGLWMYDRPGGDDPFHPSLSDTSHEAHLMRQMKNALGGNLTDVKALLDATKPRGHSR